MPGDRDLLRDCARVLEQQRHSIATGLIENACMIPRWEKQREAQGDELDQFIAREGHAFVDYLGIWVGSGNDTFKHLYVGEKLKQLYDEEETQDEDRYELRAKVLAADSACFDRHLREQLPEEAARRFAEALEEVHGILLGRGEKTLDVLFIGDCLYLDVMGFVAGPCLEDGFTVRPCYATSKDPAALGNHLRALSGRHFDVVFYSPFSYEFDVQYAQLLRPAAAVMSGRRIDDHVDRATETAGTQISLIADLFDCPIHIHNSANILRDLGDPSSRSSTIKRRLKTMLTRRTRRRASRRVDQWLRKFIEDKNDDSFKHLFLVDELAIARASDEVDLGAYIYWSELQHPCHFSEAIAAQYTDLLAVHAHLLGKKLIVCDLDNTLWEGVIGEGAVEHHHDRQARLLELKSRGVVLSINSKNDPENVHFEGGTLEASDFVYADIDWEPKVNGLRRTEQALNLKSRDFVFVDDRADERQMAAMAFPGLVVLDPVSENAWRRMAIWYELLDPELTSDRTALYKEREARRESLQSQELESGDSGALFESLEIQVRLRRADRSDLKRVHELINRTNQFNLCGTRATYAQVEQWAETDAGLILLADARDRFGDMGTVGILVVSRETDHWDIPVFVLSCRVFGYGIERAMLNQIKAWTQGTAPGLLSGVYKDTGRNQPCSTVYAENGFVERDGRWTFEGDGAGDDATWLTIHSELEPAGGSV